MLFCSVLRRTREAPPEGASDPPGECTGTAGHGANRRPGEFHSGVRKDSQYYMPQNSAS